MNKNLNTEIPGSLNFNPEITKDKSIYMSTAGNNITNTPLSKSVTFGDDTHTNRALLAHLTRNLDQTAPNFPNLKIM